MARRRPPRGRTARAACAPGSPRGAAAAFAYKVRTARPASSRDAHFASPASTGRRDRPASATASISTRESADHQGPIPTIPSPRSSPLATGAGASGTSPPSVGRGSPADPRPGPARSSPRDPARSPRGAAEHLRPEGQEVVGDPVVGPAGPSRVGHRYHSFDQPQRDEPVEGSDGLVAQRVLDLAVLAAAGGDGMQGR